MMQVWFKNKLVGHMNKFFSNMEYGGACSVYRIATLPEPDFSTPQSELAEIDVEYREIVLTFKKRSVGISHHALEDGISAVHALRAHDVPMDQPEVSIYEDARMMARVFTWMTLNIASDDDYETIFDMNDFVPA